MKFESLTNETKDVNKIFRQFLEKYAGSAPDQWRIREAGLKADPIAVDLTDARELIGVKEDPNIIPLFPWRFERRFVELAKLVSTQTVEEVVMCRFSCTAGVNRDLASILYREFDLLEWLNDSRIVSLYAAIGGGRFANIIAKLENGCVCSVEAGTTLADGADVPVLDRHELIGRRGVASDRVVDTQIPQSSVYLFGAGKTEFWTDTDAELFGLDAEQINRIRAAADLALRYQNGSASFESEWNRHRRLCQWTARAFESDQTEVNCMDKEADHETC